MVEITLAVGLLAAAILPVLTLTMRSTQQTYAMEQHVMASQFAAGILDRYLAMPFKVCADAIRGESFPKKILDTETFSDAVSAGEGFSETLQRTFRDFEYEVTVSEPSVAGEKGEMFKITVTVSWPGNPGAPPTRQFSLNAVKFNENP
jgi:Tfp pilus assembly protein PilV